jgi:hypothetical protein
MQNMWKGVNRRSVSHECLRNNTNITTVGIIQLLVKERHTSDGLYIISSFATDAQDIPNTLTNSEGI